MRSIFCAPQTWPARHPPNAGWGTGGSGPWMDGLRDVSNDPSHMDVLARQQTGKSTADRLGLSPSHDSSTEVQEQDTLYNCACRIREGFGDWDMAAGERLESSHCNWRLSRSAGYMEHFFTILNLGQAGAHREPRTILKRPAGSSMMPAFVERLVSAGGAALQRPGTKQQEEWWAGARASGGNVGR